MKFVILLVSVLIFSVLEVKASILKEDVGVLESPTIFTNRVTKYLRQKHNISNDCSEHLFQYVNDLQNLKMWALRMFDASAKVPSGILDGNLVDLGSFSECLSIKEQTPKNTIYGKYCLGQLSFTDPVKTISKLNTSDSVPLKNRSIANSLTMKLAICIPNTCKGQDIQELLESSGINMNIGENSCQTTSSQPNLDIGAIIVLSFFGVTLWWIIVSTAYDAVLHGLEKAPYHYLLVSFSILTNGKKLFGTAKSADEITCMNGIRVISTMWIILGHSYVLQATLPISNASFIVEWISSRSNMYLINATISVDTFFLIGGLTLSYVFMTYSKKGIKFNLLAYYIHRYIRLTPALGVVILFNIYLAKYMGSGPVWLDMISMWASQPCEESWWRTLLYFQNYGHDITFCIPQSWYLSADMQLFVLSPILLVPLLHWPKIVLCATGFLTLCSMAACFAITWIYKLGTTPLGSDMLTYMKYYYLSTHTRAAPWLIGIIFGYLIYANKRKNCRIVLNNILVLVFWILALLIMSLCVFDGHSLMLEKDKMLEKSFYNACIRAAWATGLGWIIFACEFGYGGIVNWFLSWKIFKMLSKLTYSLYLTHYIIIVMTTADLKTPLLLSNAVILRNVWVHYMLTLVASIVLTLAFESPIISIEKQLLTKKTKSDERSG